MTYPILSAFEPFGGRRRNLSQQVLEAWPEEAVDRRVLPVVFDALAGQVDEMIASRPAAIVLTGMSRRKKRVEVESIALNVLVSADRPDNAGQEAPERPIVEGGPLALASTWDGDAIVAALRRAGVRAVKSHHAGTYACNQVLYLTLHAAREAGLDIPIGFLHLPGKRVDRKGKRARKLAGRLASVLFETMRVRPA